jgi:hypothetical protein
MWQVFSTALCSTRRRRGRHRWDALRPDKHPAVMARRSGQGMKPLAARACARPLTAPSTMTLLEQRNRGSCAINCRIHRSLMERARSRSSAGYRPTTLPLDSLVGSLAACPIPSLRWRKLDSNHQYRAMRSRLREGLVSSLLIPAQRKSRRTRTGTRPDRSGDAGCSSMLEAPRTARSRC